MKIDFEFYYSAEPLDGVLYNAAKVLVRGEGVHIWDEQGIR